MVNKLGNEQMRKQAGSGKRLGYWSGRKFGNQNARSLIRNWFDVLGANCPVANQHGRCILNVLRNLFPDFHQALRIFFRLYDGLDDREMRRNRGATRVLSASRFFTLITDPLHLTMLLGLLFRQSLFKEAELIIRHRHKAL